MRRLILKIVFIMLIQSVALAGSSPAPADNCVGLGYCAHGQMPLISQSHPHLRDYVSFREGYNVSNNNWCVPTAFAMAAKAASLRAPDTTRSTILGDVEPLNEYEVTYGNMKTMKTDIRNDSGTSWKNAKKGAEAFFKSANGPTRSIANHSISPSNLAGEFNSRKIFASLALMPDGGNFGHSVAVHGYDNGLIKIFDPWGRIYTVRQEGNRLRYPSGYGYVQYTNEYDRRDVVLYQVYSGYLTTGADPNPPPPPPAPKPPETVPTILGNIEGLSRDSANNLLISGCACSRGKTDSIPINLHVGGPAGSPNTIAIGTYGANLASGDDVNSACGAAGNHRFQITFPASGFSFHGGKAIYIHGISNYGQPHLAITNSGSFVIPQASTPTTTLPTPTTTTTQPAPPIKPQPPTTTTLPPATTTTTTRPVPTTTTQPSPPTTTLPVDPTIMGYVDAVTKDPSGSVLIQGWACSRGKSNSIEVQLYLRAAMGQNNAIRVKGGTSFIANIANEEAVNAACGAAGSHRYKITIASGVVKAYGGQRVYVHGISTFKKPHDALTNSGLFKIPNQ